MAPQPTTYTTDAATQRLRAYASAATSNRRDRGGEPATSAALRALYAIQDRKMNDDQ